MTPIEGHGGHHAAEALRAHGVDRIFTLNGAHIWPLYDGARARGLAIVDVRHELIGAFAAEAHAKLSRDPGVCAFTAGPGVVNAMNAIVQARASGTPMLMIGGRAPQVRWGQGGLQEMDHIPLFAPTTKSAETVFETSSIGARVSAAMDLAARRRRGPVFLDVPVDTFFMEGSADAPAPQPVTPEPIAGDADAAARALAAAERPVVLLGADVWMDGAEKAARDLVERQRIPAFMNGLGRGVLPADHPLAFRAARGHAFARADLVVVVGTPLDFRLSFGSFGDARVIHVVDVPGGVGSHAEPVAWIAGPIADALEALGQATPRDRDAWVADVQAAEAEKLRAADAEMRAPVSPIHPAFVYGALRTRLARDAIVIADGGDFVSFSGRYLDVYEPGAWLDPGPYGSLGTSAGYALAAGLMHPGRQVVVMLGDGAAGFGMGDWDTLVRFGVAVTFVCGNNSGWGLEKHPQQAVYGYTVAAELRPDTRYDEVMRALGGHGELVRDPAELPPALDRALATPGPSLVNVMIDPDVAYPRSAILL